MFNEMVLFERWRKALEGAGYRVVTESWRPADEEDGSGDDPRDDLDTSVRSAA
jgi:hypothetical protein